ncbi:hypothetical protein OUZ56_016523 [Daphnia magna]|uniref:Uncharacterized protein n=1 Tax=Daphnia magna TaxID=35525 RepID=A0ABR0AQW3_9CRUS|nr:hypothetical protein OUZ56_016523 [Daphnia magna]
MQPVEDLLVGAPGDERDPPKPGAANFPYLRCTDAVFRVALGGFYPCHVDEVLGLVFYPVILFRLLSWVPGRHHVPGVVVRISPLSGLPIPVKLVGDPLLRGDAQT